jgi:hypothetical protein
MFLYVPEELGIFHAHKAARCNHEGESHQILARAAVHIMGPFQGQNCTPKEKVNSRNT